MAADGQRETRSFSEDEDPGPGVHATGWGKRTLPFRWLQRLYQFLTSDVWVPDLAGLPRLHAIFYKGCRVVYLAVRGFVRDRCLIRASALTYITILSLVPTLAFAFSLAKGFGAYDLLFERLGPFLDSTIGKAAGEGEAATNKLREAADQVLGFVQQTNVSSLGTIGALIVLYAVVKLLGTIESSFNDIWGVRRSRSLVRKITDYISIIVVTPIFLILAMTITSVAQSPGVVGFLSENLGIEALAAEGLLRWSALLAVWFGFTFVYMALPNTRTRLTSALLGAVVGGTIWQLVLVVHVKFQVGMANYNVIYSSFAALPIFMVWVHISWAVVLFGAELASAHQSEPSYRQVARAREMDQRLREVAALRALVRVAERFAEGRPAASSEVLAAEVGLPVRSMEAVLSTLIQRGLLAESETESGFVLLPGTDPDRVHVGDVLEALQGTSTVSDLPVKAPVDRRIERHLEGLGKALGESPYNRTLGELARAAAAETEVRPASDAAALHEEPAPEGG